MKLVDMIAVAILAMGFSWLIDKFYKKKKRYVKVPVSLPYTKADLLYDLAFALLALMSWGLALWIQLKTGLGVKQLLVCIILTLAGVVFLIRHFTNRHILMPAGKEQLVVEVQTVLTKINRQTALSFMPLMAAYLVSMNPGLFGISWDFEWVAIGILVLAWIIRMATMGACSKRLGFDISESDLLGDV